jgi:hypothetical protein
MTVVCSMASFGSSVQVRHGATCQKSMVPALPPMQHRGNMDVINIPAKKSER